MKTAASGQKTGGAGWMLPIGLVVAGPAALFLPMLLRGEVLYWGTPMLQFVPWRQYAFELIGRGIAPLWNPLLGMGAPLLANHQTALLYPPTWLVAALPAGWGETVLVLLHLILAAVGMIVFTRRLGLGLLGQVVAGLSFSAGSYLATRTGFPSLVATAGWLPWLLWGSDRLTASTIEGGARRVWFDVGLAGLMLGLAALAGHAQTLVYAAAFMLAWSFFRAPSVPRSGYLRLAAIWLGAGAFAFGLAAAQLLPTVEYLLQSSRSGGLEETAALTYSFWPWRTLGLLLPGLFGSPATGDYWGYGNYWEDALYIGVLPLLMAIGGAVGAFRGGRASAPVRRFLLGAAAVAFLLSLGSNNPVFTFLFRHAPLFDAFNAPTRLNLITVFCLSVLAGFGADRWRRPEGVGLYWSRLGTAGAFAMMLVGLAAMALPIPLRPSLGSSFTQAGFWLLVAGIVSLAWPRSVGHRWAGLISLLVVADLTLIHGGWIPATPDGLYRGGTDLARRIGRNHRVYLSTEAERELKFDRTHRFDSFQPELDPRWIRESGLPNTLLLDRVPSANNFDPLVPARYAAWIEAVNRLPGESREAYLRLMDVAWTSSDVGEDAPWIAYSPIAGASRAWLLPNAVPASGPQQAIQLAFDPDFDPLTKVVLEEAGAAASLLGGPGSAVVLPSDDPLRVEVLVEAPDGGWLVLADVWYPGWEAQVGAVSADLYPADGAFRAVWVPPGARQVVFSYRPPLVRAGAAVSGFTLLGGAVGWWIVRRRSG